MVPYGTAKGPSSAEAIFNHAEANNCLWAAKTDILYANLVLYGKSVVAADGSGLVSQNGPGGGSGDGDGDAAGPSAKRQRCSGGARCGG